MSLPCRALGAFLLGCLVPAIAAGQSTTYRLAFPEPERGWMQVELTIEDAPDGPLDLHMSRSSPGRYGPHDFAGNVSDVVVTSGTGDVLPVSRPNGQRWRVEAPPRTVRVRYRVSGSRVDGTYLAVDGSHAHINMPAALMWAQGFDERPVAVRFDLPDGRGWQVATQLFRGADDRTFNAPNLQYLMDSPTELSAFATRTFEVAAGGDSAAFRLVVHHEGTEEEVTALAAAAERVVRESRGIFGEFPRFDPGVYTFIADYLPRASGDGMEHRNSTILTSPRPLRSNAIDALETISHEFFHAWNVERIRPASLEPFDFTAPNASGELWLAEGFTQYYGGLILARAGLFGEQDFARELGSMVGRVVSSPATRVRTLEDMSRLAVVVDSPAAIVPVNVRETFLSYYTWGGAVGLALDLTLRERSGDRVTLDDFMRRLWDEHGRGEPRAPGFVVRPYTFDDLEATLAEVSGDRGFARQFLTRYVRSRQIPDFERLFRHVGFTLRSSSGDGMEVVPSEAAGGQVTDAQRRARAAWLRSRAGEPLR